MNVVDSANTLMNNLMAATVISLILVGGFVFYFLKIKKIGAKEEKIDYSSFQRKDAREFVKFDNIISAGELGENDGLGVVELGGKVFVAGLDVVGYNYRSASADERKATMANSIGFFNVIENPIQLRQTVKSVDLEHNIKIQEEIAKDLNKELMALDAEFKDTLEMAEAQNIDENEDTFRVLCETLNKLKKTINSKQWMYEEALEVLEYLKRLTTTNASAKKVNQIMFSYVFNPNEYIEELNENEIRVKAITALSNKANEYASVLENCGCTCNPLTARDLTELMRRHLHPYTADMIKIDDLLNSSYNALYVTSESIFELEKERQGDEAFEQELMKLKEEQEQQKREALEKAKKTSAAYQNSKETVSSYDDTLASFFE